MKNLISEPLVTYLRTREAYNMDKEPWDMEVFRNKLLMRTLVQEGIPYSLFDRIRRASPFTTQQWAELMGISYKTLQRHEQSQKTFRSIYSEKILQLAEVFGTGLEVFGGKEKFHSWVTTPSVALGSQNPIDLLGDSYGRDLVLRELNHIEYGIFA